MVSLAPEAGRLLRRVVVVGLLAIAMACFLMPYTPLYALTIAVWNKERGDSAWYFAVWVAVDTSVVLAAVVSAGDVAPVVAPPARTAKQHSRYRSALALARRTWHRLRCLRAKHASSFASRSTPTVASGTTGGEAGAVGGWVGARPGARVLSLVLVLVVGSRPCAWLKLGLG